MGMKNVRLHISDLTAVTASAVMAFFEGREEALEESWLDSLARKDFLESVRRETQFVNEENK